ncbi:MAG: hypothetical protein ACLSWS_10015 [Faecalispora jeddahensis]
MGLLDTLAEKMQCEYLSDLRYLPRPNMVLQCALAELSLEEFPESEWLDAALYLCGIKCADTAAAQRSMRSFL